MLLSCGIEDIIPSDEKNKFRTPGPEEPPPPIPGTKVNGKIKLFRKIRRLTLEVTGNLPDPKIVEKTLEDQDFLPQWLGHLGERELAQNVFADTFDQIWNLDRSPAFDLFRIAREDPSFFSILNENFIEHLKQEPLQILKRIISADSSFSSVLTVNYSTAHKDLLTQYGSTTEMSSKDLPYVLFSYNDARPKNSGIMFTNGWLASFPNFSDPFGQKRAYKMRKTILCDSMDSYQAHLFHDLSDAELQSNLVELSATKSSCINCHQPILESASYFNGLAEGKTWAEWRTAATKTSPNQEDHNRRLSNYLSYMSHDPRLVRCHVERLMAVIYQTPFGFSFRENVAKSLDTLTDSQETLQKSILGVFKSEDFYAEPLKSKPDEVSPTSSTPKDHTSRDPQGSSSIPSSSPSPSNPGKDPSSSAHTNIAMKQEISGLRVLRKDQWKRVLTQLSPIALKLQYPNELNPDFQNDSEFDDSFMIPQYPYWAAVENLAHDFAYQLVLYELSTKVNPLGVRSIDRYLFKYLPDDVKLATDKHIALQIKNLWYLMTSEAIDENSEIYLDLLTLWKNVKSQNEISTQLLDAQLIAWRSVLFVILTHPMFFTY